METVRRSVRKTPTESDRMHSRKTGPRLTMTSPEVLNSDWAAIPGEDLWLPEETSWKNVRSRKETGMNQRSDHDPTKRRRWEKAGQKRLDEQELSSASFLPFRWWEVFDLKCTVEYPVRDLLSRDQLLPDRSRRRISFCLSGLCHRHRSEAFFHVSITRTLE